MTVDLRGHRTASYKERSFHVIALNTQIQQRYYTAKYNIIPRKGRTSGPESFGDNECVITYHI